MATDFQDKRWMKAAIAAAKSAMGRTGFNPAVGAIIVSADGQLLARGATGNGGRPHAETVAINRLLNEQGGANMLRGATLYVTLEPCSHQGETGPCANAVVAAGIARVVIGVIDPDPRVNGGGVKILKDAGISVTTGVCEDEARAVMAGFLSRVKTGKPYVVVKTATSMDGMIALADRQKRWLTGPDTRRMVHLERSYSDGILTGIGTVLADDPALTCRNPGLYGDSPHRYIADSMLNCPVDAALFDQVAPNEMPADSPGVTIFCHEAAPADREAGLCGVGANIIRLARDPSDPSDASDPSTVHPRVSVPAMLREIAAAGCNQLIVEAGSRLITSLIAADAIDRLIWTQSDHFIGSDGVSAIGPLNAVELHANMHYISGTQIGSDRVVVFAKQPSP